MYCDRLFKSALAYMDKQTRLIAAHTARMLGYKIIRRDREYYPDGRIHLEVISPIGNRVVNWYYYNVPSDIEALASVQVRLDMEKHYGIETAHYWE